MAVVWTLRAPSLGRQGYRACMRSALLDVPPIYLHLCATKAMTSRDTGGVSRGWFRIESRCREQFPPWLHASSSTTARQRVPRRSGSGRAAHGTEGVESDYLP